MVDGLRGISRQAVDEPSRGEIYAFGPVRVDVARHAVTRDGQPIALAPKTFELLLILLRSGGRVLTRQELQQGLWPDSFVEEANLSFQISTLRKALGEGADQWIETVPKVGYRFTPASQPAARGDGAHDVANEVQEIGEPSSAETPVRRHRTRAGLLATVALAGATVGIAGAWLARPATPGVSVTRLSLDVHPAEDVHSGGVAPLFVLTPAGSRTSLSWTPDGKALVFVGRRAGIRQLYVRRLDETEARPLANTEGAQAVAVSADGHWVAFWTARALRKVSLDGGPAMDLATGVGVPSGLAWDSTGGLFFSNFDDFRIWRVAKEGTAAAVTTLGDGETRHALPWPLPGGNVILYTVRGSYSTWGDEHIVAHRLATGERKRLVQDAADARYVPTGHLVFLRRGTLFAQPFDAERLEVRGPAVALLDRVAQAVTAGNTADITGAGQFAISETGTLAVISSAIVPYPDANLVSLDRTGQLAQLQAPPRAYGPALRLSPGGRYLGLSIRGVGEQGLWLYDTTGGMLSLLAGRGEALFPRWSPDGRRLAFSWIEKGVRSIALQPADGSVPPQVLLRGNYVPSSWTADGRHLATVGLGGAGIVVVSATDGRVAARPLGETPHGELWPEFSPDGRWLAYGSKVSGRFEIYVRPYPGPGPPHQVSMDGGSDPAWHPGGRELFFIGYSPDDTGRLSMSVADVDTRSALLVGRPSTLFRFDPAALTMGCVPVRCFDVSPDGQRFYATQYRPRQPTPPATHVGLITNWFEELRAKVPSRR